MNHHYCNLFVDRSHHHYHAYLLRCLTEVEALPHRQRLHLTFQEEHDDVVQNNKDDDLGYVDLDPNNDDARIDGEAVVNQRDIIMLERLNEDVDDEDEPPPPSGNEEHMRDSDHETGRQIDYNSDDSHGF